MMAVLCGLSCVRWGIGLVRRRIEWGGGVCERIVEGGLGTRSDISVLTEFGASAYRAMLRNGLQTSVVTAAVRYGAMHGSSVRGLFGRCSSMDHDRGGLVGEQGKELCQRIGGMPRPMIVRMRNVLRAKANDTHARRGELQDMHALPKYASITKTLAFLMFQYVARLSTACISRRGRVLLPACK
jgi:hypothetical protein